MNGRSPWEVTLRDRAEGAGLTTEVDRSDLRRVLAALDTVRAVVAGDDFDPQPWVRKSEVRAALDGQAPTPEEGKA